MVRDLFPLPFKTKKPGTPRRKEYPPTRTARQTGPRRPGSVSHRASDVRSLVPIWDRTPWTIRQPLSSVHCPPEAEAEAKTETKARYRCGAVQRLASGNSMRASLYHYVIRRDRKCRYWTAFSRASRTRTALLVAGSTGRWRRRYAERGARSRAQATSAMAISDWCASWAVTRRA